MYEDPGEEFMADAEPASLGILDTGKAKSEETLTKPEQEKVANKAADLCRIAGSAEHQFTHHPFNPFCAHCNHGAAQRKSRF